MGYADAYKDCEWVDFDVLENFMKQVLLKSGVPEADADVISDVFNRIG